MRISSPSLLQGISRASIAAVCSAVLLLMPVSVHAIAISPSVTEVSGQRGEVLSETIQIINTNTTDQTYYLDTLKFKASEDGGSPQFISSSEDHEGLPEWIKLETSTVIVPALSSAEINYEIRIPSGADSGGHYAAITVSLTPADLIASNGAIVEAKTASLILLEVAGENIMKAELLDFLDEQNGGFQSLLGGRFTYRVQNQGNVHLNLVGTITFKDLFGREVKQVDANELGSRVLPLSTRSYEVEVSTSTLSWFETVGEQMSTFALGPISVELELAYDDTEETLSGSLTQFLFPWQLLVTVLALVFIFLLVYRLGKKRR